MECNRKLGEEDNKHYSSLTHPRSKMLFKPMVCIRLIVESFYFLVSVFPVHLDSFYERAVRFQVKNGNTRFPCVALESFKESTP